MSNTSARHYKRYLEPNCDPNDRKVPRRTKYRKNLGRLCTSSTSTNCGEVVYYDYRDAVKDTDIFTEVEGKKDITMADSSDEEDIDDVIQQDEDILEDIDDAIQQDKEDILENTDDATQQDEEDILNQGEEDTFIDESSDRDKDVLFNDGIQHDEDLDEQYEIKITISKRTILTLILAFALKYQVSDTAIVSLIEMVNVILGKNFISTSLYRLWKTFNYNKEKTVKTHFFCEKCHTYLCDNNENKLTICNTCDAQIQTGNAQKSSCFMSISLVPQIKNLVKNGIINKSYVRDFNTTKLRDQFSDLNDGKMYKKISKTESFFLTYNFSVDGIAMFNNAKGSLWPILVTINEIPPTVRFQNVLLAGLWFGKKEPKMDLYLKPFVEEAIKLANQGISVAPDFSLKAFPACCCADSVARPCIQNSTQFNGYYGCSWCKHPGFIVNGTVKYIYKEHLLYADRTQKNTIQLMNEAMKIGKSIQGIKGPSALLPIPFFHVISGFAPDYMHGIFLGVTKCLVTSWFDKHNSSCEFYLGSPVTINIVNERMSKFTFPRYNIGRIPRSINDRNLYKACEWKNFLLFMCVPCLKGILEQRYLDHISLLIGAVNLLMKKSINVKNLETADDLLLKFVTKTQELYGEEYMTYNMHLLLHFTTSVVNWGPLWCHSMFVFEGYNATLQSFIMGTCGIKTQAIKRYLLQQELLSNKNRYPMEVSNFITKINLKSKLHEKCISVNNCNLYGVPYIHLKQICTVNFPNDFFLNNSLLENAEINYFKRMTVDNMLYTIKSDRQVKTCDSFVYTETEIGEIVFIALRPSIAKVVVCIKKYEIIMKPNENIDDMYVVKNSNTFLIVDANEIIGKCTQYDSNAELVTISKVPVSYDMVT